MKSRLAFDGISMKAKISLFLSALIMLAFFVVQSLVIFHFIDHSHELDIFAYVCVLAFMPPFFFVIKEFLQNKARVIKELKQKNTYLEHAAKIIRHDMHSGINTYLPRGISSLKRRLTDQQIKDLKIEAPMKMVTEGLKHTQKVYKGVYEFTNLVKQDSEMSMTKCNIKDIIQSYLSSTSYKSQVILEDSLSFELMVNEPLFCTAVDNLIRNGIKYNDSPTKIVKIYREGHSIVIEDNGRGMSREEYELYSKPYVRKEDQKESGSGLGLNICSSILSEHNFGLRVEKIEGGISEFYKDISQIEERYNKNPDGYAFNKESLEEVAKENGYKGKVRIKRGGRNRSKLYVFYDESKDSNRGTKIKIIIKK